jgi:ABC-type glycerol-3-phosphate transport system permease component
MVNNILIILIISFIVLIIQIFSSFVAYDIYKFNRNRKGWIGVILGNAFIASQDFIFILYIRYANIQKLGLLSGFIFILLPLAISIFLLIGFISMRRSFVKFDLLSKETLSKIKNVNKKANKKRK